MRQLQIFENEPGLQGQILPDAGGGRVTEMAGIQTAETSGRICIKSPQNAATGKDEKAAEAVGDKN